MQCMPINRSSITGEKAGTSWISCLMVAEIIWYSLIVNLPVCQFSKLYFISQAPPHRCNKVFKDCGWVGHFDTFLVYISYTEKWTSGKVKYKKNKK